MTALGHYRLSILLALIGIALGSFGLYIGEPRVSFVSAIVMFFAFRSGFACRRQEAIEDRSI